MAQLVLLAVSTLTVYTLWRIDFSPITVLFASLIAYHPVGFVLGQTDGVGRLRLGWTTSSSIAALSIASLSIFAFNTMSRQRSLLPVANARKPGANSFATLFCVLFTLVFLGARLLFPELFASKETIYSSQYNILLLLIYPLSICSIVAMRSGRTASQRLALISLCVVSVVTFDRSTVVLPLIAVIYGSLQGRSLKSLLERRQIAVLGMLVAIVLFGKPLGLAIAERDIGLLGSSVSQFSLATSPIIESPIITAHLSSVIEDPRHYPGSEALDTLLQVTVVPGAFGANSESFSQHLQREYLPDAQFGVGASYLAEGFVVGGMIGIFIWMLLACIALASAARVLTRASSDWTQAWLLYAVAVGSFFIFRNSIETTLTMVRLAGVSAVALSLASRVAAPLIPAPRPASTHATKSQRLQPAQLSPASMRREHRDGMSPRA